MNVITENEALSTFCVRAARHPFVAVDTEFLRERTFWPQLCLVQLATPDEEAIVDPLADGLDLKPLLQLMADEAVVKVFHAARQDVEIFYKLTGGTPQPLFDTQVAAMVCGFGESVGYDTLVSKLTGARIDKSQRFADWSARPLRDKQLAYALSDVTHLRDVYPMILDRLEDGGRADWVAEEMAALADPALYARPPEDAWRRLKVRGGDRRFMARVKALAAWREETAQTKDVPRSRVVRDETLIDVAANAPTDSAALSRARGVTKGLAEGRYGQEMLAVLADAAATPEDALPAVEDKPIVNGAGPLGALLQKNLE
ncbi:MAG: ribonuclease D [Pseudomonadota bacterium]